MSKTVSKETAQLLRSIVKYVNEQPSRLDMDWWGQFYPPGSYSLTRNGDKIPPCRTTACLAGHALLLTPQGQNYLKHQNAFHPYEFEGKKYIEVAFPEGTAGKAQKILGITKDQAARLFYVRDDDGGWPQEFVQRYNKAQTAKTRAKVFAARVDHFIKTGE